MPPRRRTKTSEPDSAEPQEVSPVVEELAPLDSPADPEPEGQASAPLIPPDGGPGIDGGDGEDGGPDPAATSAAPLEPPAQPEPDPQPEPMPEPMLDSVPLGVDYLDIVDEDGDPVAPEDMFEDVNAAFTYVLSARRLYKTHRKPGARRTDQALLYPPSRKVDRGEAARLEGELRALRAARR